MRWFLPLSALLLPSFSAQAAENWEICLDKADFTFNVDSFFGSTSITKTQCTMRFAISGGKGERFELDLCSPVIQIQHFPTIDGNAPQTYVAGSAACPKPMFGADFDENSIDIQDYVAKKKKIFELWESVKNMYGEGANAVDLSNPKSFSPEVSAGKIACGTFLLKEYLQKCMAFERRTGGSSAGKSASSSPATPPGTTSTAPATDDAPLMGVHPQTIKAPKGTK